MNDTRAAGTGGTLARYRAALEHAPKTKRALPAELTRLDAIRRKLWAVPTDMSGINAVILDADPERFEDALDEAAREHARRQVAEAAIKAGAGAAIEQRVTKALARFLPELIKRLRPVFDEAAETLARVAADLPSGDGWSDPAKVLAAGVEQEHRAALSALATIDAVRDVYEPTYHRARGADACTVVEPPAGVGPVVIHPRSRVNVDPEAAKRSGVAANLLDAWHRDPRRTLVGVARGEHPGCTLSLAGSSDELTARIDAAESARGTRVATAEDVHRTESPDTLGARRMLHDYAASIVADA